MALVSCLCGGYNLYRFSDGLSLVIYYTTFLFPHCQILYTVANFIYCGKFQISYCIVVSGHIFCCFFMLITLVQFL